MDEDWWEAARQVWAVHRVLATSTLALWGAWAAVAAVLGSRAWVLVVTTVVLVVAMGLNLLRHIGRYRAQIPPEPLPPIVDHLTDRLRIRRLLPTDAKAMVASIDDELIRINGWPPDARETQREGTSAELDWGRRGGLVACDRASGEPVVFLGVSPAQGGPGRWQMGLHTVAHRRGEGLATEALVGALEVVHRAGIETVHLGTAEDNLPMQRTIVGAGGLEVLRAPFILPNGRVDPVIWYQHTARR